MFSVPSLRYYTFASILLGWTCVATAAEVETEARLGDQVATAPSADPAGVAFEVSLLAAYGAGGRFEDSNVNRYGIGMGLRAGAIVLDEHAYVGISFMRFLGGEDSSGKYYTSTLDAEMGYDFQLFRRLLVIRPLLGLGVAQPVSIQSDNAGYPLGFHFAPGLLVGMRLSPVFVSAGVRRDIVPGQWSNATTITLGVGAVF